MVTLIGLLLSASIARAEFEHLVCKETADCAVALNSCGGPKAVNKKFKDEFMDAIGCDSAAVNLHVTSPTYVRVACRNGRCELVRISKYPPRNAGNVDPTGK